MEEQNQDEECDDNDVEEESLDCSGISCQILHVSAEDFSELQTH